MENTYNKRNPFYIKSYTDVIDGNGITLVQFHIYPITDFISIIVDEETLTADDYELYAEAGYLVLKSCAKEDNQNITAEYEAGLYIRDEGLFTNVPKSLQEIVLLLVEDIILQKTAESSAASDVSEWSIEDFKIKSGAGSSMTTASDELKSLIKQRQKQYNKINVDIL